MNAIVIEGNISPRISFIVSLLDEAVKCGPKHSKYILQLIPPNMVSFLDVSIDDLKFYDSFNNFSVT